MTPSSTDQVFSSSSSSSTSLFRLVSDFESFYPEPTKMRTTTSTTTSSSSKKVETMFNQYENGVKEYVFSVSKRPFGMVTSPNLPVPSTSYIDFGLVDKLGLPISDIKYRKLTYCGKKMRIVGKISITVQSVRQCSCQSRCCPRPFFQS